MNDKDTVRVLICTGPTGGHFFPALSCGEALRKEYPQSEIHFLLNRIPWFTKDIQREKFVQFHLIPFRTPPGLFSFKFLLFLLEYGVAILRTFFLFLKIRPKLVIGFGSYGSVAGVLCGALWGRPILLHEQNASFGRANQFLAPFAARIAASFPETEGELERSKVFLSGYPLRRFSMHEKPAGKTRFTMMVLGGSQGARSLNDVFLSALEGFSAEERADFAVIHIVGSDDPDRIRGIYRRLGIWAEVIKFSDRIFEWYQSADLVVSRAGAGTIFELAQFGKAAIVVPYPYAYAHQKVNAAYLERSASARCIDESQISPLWLGQSIRELRNDPAAREKLEEKMRGFAQPDAARNLAQAGWKLICEKN
ncbi:MAG: UDP-N-acetylglucosamine--N-acetylmuramyl-(pentapeptide) pyrophosphoryl-undecaprenol N-acetylglucosamine transferase [Candidatus Omnitrophica bacterium]|nr:UDP-N-acetylglucosamine--N-acetylmuramyl-(pentapeptide) pyrophosphoryl-undecaprenol N-acetylglucosamine transferase [Candidatus Omnitrophota bacterium]